MLLNDENIVKTGDIKAELLISVLWDKINEWTVSYNGTFNRNYAEDIVEADINTGEITLSRNGIYDVLPELLFFRTNDLNSLDSRDFKEQDEKLHLKRNHIKDFFKPFDSILFNKSIQLEKLLNEYEAENLRSLLLRYFDYDITEERDFFVRKFAPMMLFAARLRGNFRKLSAILSVVTDCFVTYTIRKRHIRFVVIKENLNAAEYKQFTSELKPLFDMVEENFIPFDARFDYRVKNYVPDFAFRGEFPLLLDYNTHFKK